MTRTCSCRRLAIVVGLGVVLTVAGVIDGVAQTGLPAAGRLVFDAPAKVAAEDESCVIVTYDLRLPPDVIPETAKLEYSLDSGVSYREATGAIVRVDPGTTSGTHRQICWEAGRDVEVPSFDKLPLRVIVIAVRVTSEPAAVVATPASPAVPTRATPVVSPLLGRVNPGDRVRVELASGKTLKGRVADLAPNDFGLDNASNRVSHDAVQQVRVRRPDSIWNGLLLGTGLGAAAGFGVGSARKEEYCALWDSRQGFCTQVATYTDDAWKVEGAVIGAAAGAVLGAVLDAMRHRYDIVYSQSGRTSGRMSVVPRVDATRAVLDVHVRF